MCAGFICIMIDTNDRMFYMQLLDAIVRHPEGGSGVDNILS